MSLSNSGEYIVATAKAAPPATVSVVTAVGYRIPLQEAVLWVTLTYTLALFAHLIWKWRREARGSE